VALTFDDGPQSPWTGQILDILAHTGTPATFFVLGEQIRGEEATLRRMVAQGCAVEVHSWAHTRMTSQHPTELTRDIARTRELIHTVTGHQAGHLRPPEGRISRQVLDCVRDAGLTAVFWSVHAADWARPGVAEIEEQIITGLDDGAVVLLHDAGGERDQTVAALPRIISEIHARGLRPVSLATLPDGAPGRQPATEGPN
jgi:peptidoglycan/xylan/chitin deacetylase (PgdA/CDA1 family)